LIRIYRFVLFSFLNALALIPLMLIYIMHIHRNLFHFKCKTYNAVQRANHICFYNYAAYSFNVQNSTHGVINALTSVLVSLTCIWLQETCLSSSLNCQLIETKINCYLNWFKDLKLMRHYKEKFSVRSVFRSSILEHWFWRTTFCSTFCWTKILILLLLIITVNIHC